MAPTKVEGNEQVDIENLFSVSGFDEELDKSLAWQKSTSAGSCFPHWAAADSHHIIEMGTVKVMKVDSASGDSEEIWARVHISAKWPWCSRAPANPTIEATETTRVLELKRDDLEGYALPIWRSGKPFTRLWPVVWRDV